MFLKKISLFSYIFFITSMFYNHINAMENDMDIVTRSIQEKLLIFDAAIIKIAQNLKIAKVQMNNDKKIFEDFEKNYFEKKSQSYFFNEPQYDFRASEIEAYKGEFQHAHSGKPHYNNNGSKGKYDTLKKALITDEDIYNRFTARLERGKRHNNIEYLRDIEKELQDYKVTIIEFTASNL